MTEHFKNIYGKLFTKHLLVDITIFIGDLIGKYEG